MNDFEDRRTALEIAIKEVAAYKESSLDDGHTERLISSAEAIYKYIRTGTIPSE
jgi:hypothetical protein